MYNLNTARYVFYVISIRSCRSVTKHEPWLHYVYWKRTSPWDVRVRILLNLRQRMILPKNVLKHWYWFISYSNSDL